MVGVDPGYLNVGLMKPRKGFTLVAGKEKWGWARTDTHMAKEKMDPIFPLRVYKKRPIP